MTNTLTNQYVTVFELMLYATSCSKIKQSLTRGNVSTKKQNMDEIQIKIIAGVKVNIKRPFMDLGC